MAKRVVQVEPDFEIVIRRGAAGGECLVAGVFIEENGLVDFGLGWDGEAEISGLCALLESLAMALSGCQSWVDAHGISKAVSEANEKRGDVPF